MISMQRLLVGTATTLKWLTGGGIVSTVGYAGVQYVNTDFNASATIEKTTEMAKFIATNVKDKAPELGNRMVANFGDAASAIVNTAVNDAAIPILKKAAEPALKGVVNLVVDTAAEGVNTVVKDVTNALPGTSKEVLNSIWGQRPPGRNGLAEQVIDGIGSAWAKTCDTADSNRIALLISATVLGAAAAAYKVYSDQNKSAVKTEKVAAVAINK